MRRFWFFILFWFLEELCLVLFLENFVFPFLFVVGVGIAVEIEVEAALIYHSSGKSERLP